MVLGGCRSFLLLVTTVLKAVRQSGAAVLLFLYSIIRNE